MESKERGEIFLTRLRCKSTEKRMGTWVQRSQNHKFRPSPSHLLNLSPRPWEAIGKPEGPPLKLGICVCSVTQLCLTLCNPMDFSLSGSSHHGLHQAVILETVIMPFSRGSFQPRDWTCVSYIAGIFFTHRATAWTEDLFSQRNQSCRIFDYGP